MKRVIIISSFLLLFTSGFSQVKFFLGLRAGAGVMLTQAQLEQMRTTEGAADVFRNNKGWSIHTKAEALLGIRNFRIGYRFLYNFSSPQIEAVGVIPVMDDHRFTTYFSSRQDHFFAHYGVMELALINLPHFSLVPGIAAGTFGGFKVDNGSNEKVRLGEATHHRFSIGAELNAEIKFGRCAIVLGPHYYLFALQDKISKDWRQYQHSVGADLGLRVNLVKAKAKAKVKTRRS